MKSKQKITKSRTFTLKKLSTVANSQRFRSIFRADSNSDCDSSPFSSIVTDIETLERASVCVCECVLFDGSM